MVVGKLVNFFHQSLSKTIRPGLWHPQQYRSRPSLRGSRGSEGGKAHSRAPWGSRPGLPTSLSLDPPSGPFTKQLASPGGAVCPLACPLHAFQFPPSASVSVPVLPPVAECKKLLQDKIMLVTSGHFFTLLILQRAFLRCRQFLRIQPHSSCF